MTSTLQKTKVGQDVVIESYNLFLNSDDGKNNGQNYDFQLGNNSVNTRGPGQYIRLSLINFSMYKNWTDVNPVNHGLVLRHNAGALAQPVIVNDYNYAVVRDLAINLGTAMLSAVQTALGLGTLPTWSNVLPVAGTGINGTTDNVIGFTIETTGHGLVAADLDNGNFALQAVIDPVNLPAGVPTLIDPQGGGDAGLLFGCDRTPASFLGNSWSIDISDPSNIVFKAPYPAQRSTEANVFMRVNPSPQVFASEAFAQPLTTDGDNPLNPGNILAEIRIDTEVVQYEPPNDRQYFANLYQKTMSHLQIGLTDSRNRALPTFGTATANNQTTKGNRHFTATIRVDIVQDTAYGENPVIPESAVFKSKLPARFDSNVLVYQKNGADMYGKPMGF